MSTGPEKSEPRIVAVIDIGSNSIRMVVAQVLPEGRIDVLEQMRRPVRLGQDTFLRQQLSQRTINAATGILRDYRRVLDSYHVSQIRAVATSAVREAANADAFLDRVLMAANIEVEVIEPTEEGRLTVNAVLHAMGDGRDLRSSEALIADIGGGSALLTLLHQGEITACGSFALGSIRLQELLATSQEPPDRAAELLRHQIGGTVNNIRSALPIEEVRHFIAVGGDARFAAAQIGKRHPTADLSVVGTKEFDKFVGHCAVHTAAELARIYGIPFADAETLVPALLGYQALLRATQVGQILVSDVSMRDGLLLDITQSLRAEEAETIRNSIIHSAKGIGVKYHYDAEHAQHVAELAVRVFDVLAGEHRLSSHERLLLQVAALLHEIGMYVAGSSHHKHSYYLIANSEVFGLRRAEMLTVALVARYHRRSPPKRTHPDYMGLPREKRMVVSKLAAILRVADALDRGHAQQVREVRFELTPAELIIYVSGLSDLTLERRALAAKADLFGDVYGLRVRLEEADVAPVDLRPTESLQ
jgi:exopolyphosphatase/guanosine-5'-triphosphate,3'-diphosphate pyrophosphatase